jgi:hypothetical protein
VAKDSNVLWTDTELVSAVDAYLFLLQAQRAGLTYPKDIEGKLLLSGSLKVRNDGSLRYRMRNISAVIKEMGGPTLAAYSPAEQVGTHVRARLRTILADRSQFRTILEEAEGSKSAISSASEDRRIEAIDRLDQLRRQVSELERELIGIGHNQPPEPLLADGLNRNDFEQARQNIRALENEVNGATPNPKGTQEHAARLLEFGLKVAIWAGERATKFADATLKLLAPVVVAKATGLAPLIIDVLRAVARAVPF